MTDTRFFIFSSNATMSMAFQSERSSKGKLNVTLQIDAKTRHESDNSEHVVAVYRSRVKNGFVTSILVTKSTHDKSINSAVAKCENEMIQSP